MEIIAYLLPIINSLILAGILGVIKSFTRKQRETAINREKHDCLTLKNSAAMGDVIIQMARCIRGEKPNGELTEALDNFKETREQLVCQEIKMTVRGR